MRGVENGESTGEARVACFGGELARGERGEDARPGEVDCCFDGGMGEGRGMLF